MSERSKTWTIGQQCEIYDRARRRWIDGEVLDLYSDEEGDWVKVQYGNKINEIHLNDPDLRSKSEDNVTDPNQEKAILSRDAKVTSAVDEIYSKIDLIKPLMRDIIAKTHDLKKDEVKDDLSWYNLMRCVRHELYPAIAMSLSQAVQELVLNSGFMVGDLSEDAVKRVIDVLKTRTVLFSQEIAYIERLVDRARTFQWEETEGAVISDHRNLSKKDHDEDLSVKWPGLTMNVLIDIYSVHKALLFGQFKFTDYTKDEFKQNIESAEQRVFEDSICSPFVDDIESALNLSFHPSYIINDDLFEVMSCHFAVSLLMNQLLQQHINRDTLRIRSIVVPTDIISVYDPEIEHKSSIKDIGNYLNTLSPSNIHLCRHIQGKLDDIESMTRPIQEMVQFIIQSASSGDIVIVFNRRNGLNTVSVFECDDNSELNALYINYFIGFELIVDRDLESGNGNDSNYMVRCWLNFGVNQRLRFYPEYLIWIIPRLFARNDTMTARQIVEKMYGAPYKWGWRVSVDDLVFNRYYHIITEYEHISNNYNRTEMVITKSEMEFGIRDHLEQNVQRRVAMDLMQFFEDNAFDSDAILNDVVGAQSMKDLKEYGRAKASNVGDFMSGSNHNHLHFRALKHSLFRYQGMVCCSENAMSIEECPFIEDVVADLQRLKECDLEMDATNIWLFDLESIVTSWDHILSVHESTSDDTEERKQRIGDYILQRVQCENGSKCKVLREQRQRRREKRRADRVEMEPDGVTAECEALRDVLFGIHCAVLHEESELNRDDDAVSDQVIGTRFEMAVSTSSMASKLEQKEDSKTEEEDDDDIPIAIDFGVSVLRWLYYGQSPRFESLRLELIQNPESTIDYVTYDRIRRLAAAKCKDSAFTVDEMVSLKSYSDTNDFQAALGRAHWDSATPEQRQTFYNWAMSLYRVHLKHSMPIPTASNTSTTPRPLYTGLNKLLTLSHELSPYYGPLSTTTSREIAINFSKGNGQIFTYQSSYDNPLRFCMGINMRTISGFPQEREVMLYHQFLPIQSTKTFDDDSEVLVNHLLYSLKSRSTPIVNEEAFYKRLGIKWTSSWIPLILSHKLLFQKTAFGKHLILERLGTELAIEPFRLLHSMRLQKTFTSEDLTSFAEKCSAYFEAKALFGNVEVKEDVFSPHFLSTVTPLVQRFREDITRTLGLTVHVKLRNGGNDFVEIGNFASNDYEIQTETPLVIAKSLNVPTFDPKTFLGGSVRIKSFSDILISVGGGIAATFNHINVFGKALNAKHRRMQTVNRRVICLIANGTISINGTLACSALDNDDIFMQPQRHSKAQTKMSPICITAKSVSITGKVFPIPDIVIKQQGVGSVSREITWSDSEQNVPLEVCDHRGHFMHKHAKNLTNTDLNFSSYVSDHELDAVGDWIIFKRKSSEIMKPSSIRIVNGLRSSGIKRIALWMRNESDDAGKWIKIAEDIDGIDNSNKEIQKFPLNPLISDEVFMDSGYDLLMVEVIENYGGKYNGFNSFHLFGHLLVDEDDDENLHGTGKEEKRNSVYDINLSQIDINEPLGTMPSLPSLHISQLTAENEFLIEEEDEWI